MDQDILRMSGFKSIVYLTTAKERIRWLSRHLVRKSTFQQTTEHEKQRSELPMGDVTDDMLANCVFMYGDENNQRAADYLDAAKARILWLDCCLEQVEK